MTQTATILPGAYFTSFPIRERWERILSGLGYIVAIISVSARGKHAKRETG
jgi:hypothetical protein